MCLTKVIDRARFLKQRLEGTENEEIMQNALTHLEAKDPSLMTIMVYSHIVSDMEKNNEYSRIDYHVSVANILLDKEMGLISNGVELAQIESARDAIVAKQYVQPKEVGRYQGIINTFMEKYCPELKQQPL